jgi:hypothetical protein
MLTICDRDGKTLRLVKIINSPWGTVQSCTEYQRGLKFVSTASHGGYLISKVLASRILSPLAFQSGAEVGNYLAYEEDVDAMIIDIELYDTIKPNRTKDEIIEALSKWRPEYCKSLGQ